MEKTKQKNFRLTEHLINSFEVDCKTNLLNQSSVVSALLVYWLECDNDERQTIIELYNTPKELR